MELCSLQHFYLTMFYYFKKGMLILQRHNAGGRHKASASTNASICVGALCHLLTLCHLCCRVIIRCASCWVWSHIGNWWWGGGTTYMWGQSSPIRLVIWVELRTWPIVVGSGGPRPDGAPACGYSGLGQNPLSHSNKWYQSRRSKKLGKHLRVTWWRGSP
jgi:hypothetical protein